MMRKICLLLSIIIVINCFTCISVQAEELESNELIKEKIFRISDLINEKIDCELDEIENEVKNRCIVNKYDYYSSIESLKNQNNPYKETDYIAIIAAYITVKSFSKGVIDDLYRINFVKSEYKVDTMDSYQITSIPAYVETSMNSGKYVQLGTDIISFPTVIPVFEKNSDGYYEIIGEEEYIPDTEQTVYLQVELSGLTDNDIYEYYHFQQTEASKKYYKSLYNKMSNIVNGNGINTSSFLQVMNNVTLTDEQNNIINSIIEREDISYQVKAVITVACSLIGRVPYEWGGKASHPGYDQSWWSINGSTNIQKGLDCSGFVQWAFMTAGFPDALTDQMISTTSILHSMETISQNELQPGDIGLLNSGEGMTNHTGIYIGDGYWIHCSSGKKTVAVEQTNMFTIYKKFPTADLDEKDLDHILSTEYSLEGYYNTCDYSDNDIYLLAQLIYNEAVGEGMNGWIAVAEVVKNRLTSDKFPGNMRDIIYSGQFADADKIATRQPSDSMVFVAKQVLNGNMTIFNNPQVLFFRNAGGSTQDWGQYPYYATINHHQFYTCSDTITK